MSVKITGLKDLEAKMKDLGTRAENLDGTHKVPLTELITSSFIQSCSRFSSVEELFKASGFKIDSAEDFKALPDGQWDDFISHNTNYDSWDEILSEAVKIWTKNQLGL